MQQQRLFSNDSNQLIIRSSIDWVGL